MRERTQLMLRAQGLDPLEVNWIVENALREDLGADHLDVTSVATIPADQIDTADVIARGSGVLAGLAVAAAVFESLHPDVQVRFDRQDGEEIRRDDVLATVTGPTRAILAGERTALNLLSRMSGVATHTAAWVRELAGTKAKVLDTRKTTPGLRPLEKYAVRAGGGTNKRMGLYDVAMIKDNHKLAAGSVTAALDAVRRRYPQIVVQVEVTTVAEAREAVAAGATFLLCDNMGVDQLREVVAAVGGRAELEATGGLSLEWAAKVAETGVDYLSVGALTHSSPIVDIALDLRHRE